VCVCVLLLLLLCCCWSAEGGDSTSGHRSIAELTRSDLLV
jgi:hypothetical protein